MEDNSKHTTDIAIIGGGPVGLFLAILLSRAGIPCRVLEQRRWINRHSKSLGIHPVSLELFAKSGIAEPFVENGVKIKKGHAFIGRGKTGTIDFRVCPRPFNYILSCPQFRTESLLEQHLKKIAPECLIRGAKVTRIRPERESVRIDYTHFDESRRLRARYAAGCDGKNSIVRHSAGIEFTGRLYPDTYIMGDFEDNTDFGPDAVVYLHREGLIESFPLPENYRRWVVKTDRYIENPERDSLEKGVRERIGHSLAGTQHLMLSSFGVQHYLASTLYNKRCLLAGDAAHIVSPIGGQGMNLGWLGAWKLAESLENALYQPAEAEKYFNSYSRQQRKTARKTGRRAEFNMWLGRKRRFFPYIRNSLVRMITLSLFKKKMARIFTMRDLL